MVKKNNPIDFAGATATQFSINPPTANTPGPNNLDVNGTAAIGSFAGVVTAPANGLIVSGNVGIGTSATAAFGLLTAIATPTTNQSLFYASGVPNFGATTTAAAIESLGGSGATSGNTVTNSSGYTITPQFNNNAGTITNACAVRIGQGTAGAGTGTITNAYALYATTPAYAGTGTNVYTAYFQGKTGFNTTGPLNLVDINGSLAIGTYAGAATAPTNGLIVSGLAGFGTSAPDPANQVTIGPTLINSATQNTALNVSSALTSNAVAPNSNEAVGLYISPSTTSNSASAIVASSYGTVITPSFSTSGTGSITTATGLYLKTTATISGTGATTGAFFGLYTSNNTAGSQPPVNSYGIYVTAASGAVNNYTAYFALGLSGGVGLGVAVPPDALDVLGNAAIGTYAGVTTAPLYGLIVSGNLGIGTASPPPGAALTVASTASTTNMQCQIGDVLTNNGSNTALYGFFKTSAYSVGASTTNLYGHYANHALTVASSGTVTNDYNNYFDTNSVTLGAGASIINAYNLYVLTPTAAKNNYCAYMQGTIYIPSGWTIGQPGGTADICAAYVENGSYSPTLSGSTAAGTITYSTRAGFYTQIGKRLFVDVQLVYTAIGGATGNIQVSVPVAARTVTNIQFNGSCSLANIALPNSAGGVLGTNSTNPPSVILASGGTVCTFYSSQNAVAGTTVPITPFTNPSTIQFCINYLIT